MPKSHSVSYTESPAAVMKRMADAVRAGLEAAVTHWHDDPDMMASHFTAAANSKYGYQKRKGDGEPPRVPRGPGGSLRSNNSYSWQKRRRYGHNKPLVYTGASRDAAKSAVKVSSRKTAGSSGTQVESWAAMPALPKYFYQRRKDHNAPDKPAELTRATPEEEQRLAGIVERHAATLLNRPQPKGK